MDKGAKFKLTRRSFVVAKLTIAILSISFLHCYGTTKVMIKANIIKGESFVTANTIPDDIESVVSTALMEKGFEVVPTVTRNENILFVDLFVYQFYGQYPAITITIRTNSGVHYIDQEYTKIFIDRNAANLHLASELAERVPADIDKSMLYRVGLRDILSGNKIVSSSAVVLAKPSRVNYFSTIKWTDGDTVPFIIPSELNIFMLQASNYEGLKKHLLGGPIVLKLRINSSARFELVDIVTESPLDENRRSRIQNFVNSFPLWITEDPVEGIEIAYGVSSR